MNNYNCIVVLGPTASGKTRLACQLAGALNGEVISADSRQVYKQLDIGTGKDLNEYAIAGKKIKHHLIDICEPNQQFYLHDFIAGCEKAFNEIRADRKMPIICGGTGLYLDALRKDFSFTQIKENETLRQELALFSKEELLEKIKQYPAEFTQHADLNSVKRMIRAIEIADFLNRNGKVIEEKKPYAPFYIQVTLSAEKRKELISQRLVYRINNGLIEEVESLLSNGVTHERLQFFGLEYKFVSVYLQNKITKEELFQQLQTAIFQFSKRQMTWFRKMEKEGVKIHLFERDGDVNELLGIVKEAFSNKS